MKKIIAILLVAMMALSLVACGEKPAPTPDLPAPIRRALVWSFP